MQSEESKMIIVRFFEAIDYLVENKQLNGKSSYCKYYNINRRNFYSQKKDPSRGWFQVSWIVPLVRYYKINPRWLLTGAGPMVKVRPDKSD